MIVLPQIRIVLASLYCKQFSKDPETATQLLEMIDVPLSAQSHHPYVRPSPDGSFRTNS